MSAEEQNSRFEYDSTDWSINFTAITQTTTAVMIVTPFLLGSLSIDASDEGKNVLAIGLGGGSFNMALKRWKPEVNITVAEMDGTVATIAYRWFDIRNSDGHKIVVQDGIAYLETVTSQGKKYDAVIVDACEAVERSYSEYVKKSADANRYASVAMAKKEIATISFIRSLEVI
ncbi:hypothetical protein ANCCEY_13643 [Ancylostoma ceylanicum]|uniref:PABS domain-containing protein n=1 Tax=Ancylostoma ceylanicum TaxID=53326 RepID=A0A0D6LBT6_9BILA|nr:hypothetical protein ANCCEY_13643 [Ancylostoma ceylanicum]